MVHLPRSRKFKNYLSIFFLIFLLSCSAEKDTAGSRFYHSTTSFFNGYYNADQLFKETTRQLEAQYKYPEQGFIEVVYYGTEDEAKSLEGEMQRVIEKNDAVIFKHPNGRYIDNCRFLNGKAWFYRQEFATAMTNFDYVLDEFPGSSLVPEIWLWKAKAFYFDGNPEMTFSIIDDFFLNSDTFELNKEQEVELALFRTRIAVEQEEYQQAINILDPAQPNIDDPQRRNRAAYLLGQLHSAQNNFAKALEQFRGVEKKTNDYELSFSAKMQIADLYTTSSGAQSTEINDYLEKLLKDEKNEEFQDQIYYKYAMLELTKGNRDGAIDYLNQSVRTNVSNQRQKALAYYKMGQLYFAVQDYDNAQAYYDSAATSITETALEYKEITGIAKTLREYISYKNTIHYQDSMLWLADLPTDRVDKIVNEIIAAEKEAERLKQEAEMEALRNNDPFFNPMLNQQNNRRTTPGSSPGGVWYFDNPQAVSNGRIQFQQQWGNRKNEDDWRRSQKAMSMAGDSENAENAENAAIDSALVEKYGDKAKYYKDIPKNDEEKVLANEKIETAYFKLGQLYSQQLSEPDSAAMVFEELLKRYPDGEYVLRTHYALYKIYAAAGNRKADYHKNFILTNHPNTVYALLIQGKDPAELKKEEEEFKYAYRGLFAAYSNKQYETSIGFSEFLLAQAAENPSTPGLDMANLHYIRGMSYGFTGAKDSLRRILTYVVQNYPNAEVTPSAQKTLDYLFATEGGPQGSGTPPLPSSTASEIPPSASVAANTDVNLDDPRFKGFSPEAAPNDKVFVLMYVDKNKIAKKEATSKVSNFNNQNYKGANLKVFTFLYKQSHLLPYISHFTSVEDAKAYIAAFRESPAAAAILQSPDEKIFFITHSNFKVAYGQKRMTDYIDYYSQVLQQ
jgi:tetratricopeptide (TPR) repeat protein